MTNLKGGYILINKTDADIYASVEKALTQGKPILFYEDATTCYYIDTISKSGDDIVLTKGGKTITITDANVVTESGEIQPTGSSKSYLHNIRLTDEFYDFSICIINNNSNQMNYTDILNYLKDDYTLTYNEETEIYEGKSYTLGVTGGLSGGTGSGCDNCFIFNPNDDYVICFATLTSGGINNYNDTSDTATIIDTII